MRCDKSRGFTLLEIMVVVAIIGILATLAMVVYQKYIERARGSDIVVKYDALRSTFNADTEQKDTNDCADLVKRAGNARLNDDYAQLGYGFEAVAGGGYRPVLTVCAKADTHGTVGVNTARGAHDTLAKNGRVEKGAVLTDTVVSFALPLIDGDKAMCKSPPLATQTACGAVPPALQSPEPAKVAAAVGALPAVQALPLADRQVVGAMAADVARDPKFAQVMQEALATATAGQAVGVPASADKLNEFTARCPANRLGPPWPAADRISSGQCPASMTANCNVCSAATICPVSCGLTKGISPALQKVLDVSFAEARRMGCEVRYGVGDPRCRQN